MQKIPALLVQFVAVILEQCLRVTLHRSDRGTKIVRDAIRKFLHLRDGLHQGSGAFGYANLELVVVAFEGLSRLAKFRDIPGDFGCADDFPGAIAQWRDRQRDIEKRTVLFLADRFVVIDSFTSANSCQDTRLLALTFQGYKEPDWLADGFVGRVPENAFRPLVPARDDAIEALGYDRIV